MLGVTLSFDFYGSEQSQPLAATRSDSASAVAELLMANIQPRRPENRIEILTLVGDSAPAASVGRDVLHEQWTAASAIFTTEASWTHSRYCVEAPAGKRIIGHRVTLLETVNTAPQPETFFKVVAASDTRVCFEVDVRPGDLTCPPPATCAVAPPTVKWRIEAELANRAA